MVGVEIACSLGDSKSNRFKEDFRRFSGDRERVVVRPLVQLRSTITLNPTYQVPSIYGTNHSRCEIIYAFDKCMV